MPRPVLETLTPEQFAAQTINPINEPANLRLAMSPEPGVDDVAAAEAAYQAKRRKRAADQALLESQHGKTATALTQLGRGALDALLAPGALLGAGAEAVGAATGLQGVEKFGRDLGKSSSGAAAMAAVPAVPGALAYVFGSGDPAKRSTVDAVDEIERDIHEQEKAWPMLSAMSRLAGTAGAALATGAAAGLASGGVAAPGLAASAGTAAVEGAEFGAQAAYEHDAPLRDVLTASAIGAAISGGTVFGLHEAFKAFSKMKNNISLERAANQRAVESTGAVGAQTNLLRPDQIDSVGRTLRLKSEFVLPSAKSLSADDLQRLTAKGIDPDILDGKAVISKALNPEELNKRVDAGRIIAGEKLGAIRETVKQADLPAIDSAREWLKSVDDQIRELQASAYRGTREKADDLLSISEPLRAAVQAQDDVTAKMLDMTSEIRGSFLDRSLASKSASTRSFVEKMKPLLDDAEDAIKSGGFDRPVVKENIEKVLTFFKSHPSRGIRARAKEMVGEIKDLRGTMSKAIGIDDLSRTHEGLKEALGYTAKQRPGAGIRLASPSDEQFFNAERAMEGITERFNESALKQLGKDAAEYTKFRDLYSALKKADLMGERAVGHRRGQNDFGLPEYISGGMVAAGQLAAGDVTAPIKGLAAAWAMKQARSRGNSFLTVLYTKLLSDSVKPAMRMLLPAAESTAAIIGKTSEHAFIEHAREAVTEGLHRVPKTTLAAGISQFLPRPVQERLSVADQQKQYSERIEQLAKLSTAPDGAAAAAILGALPPEMAAVVGVQFAEKLKQLMADMPKPEQTLRGKESLSSDDVRKGNAMWEATVEPMTIFDDYRKGIVDYDKVQYVWKQYPGMKELMQVAFLDTVQVQLSAEQKQKIPENIWTQIDYMLGFGGQLQASIDPGFSARMDQLGAQDRSQQKKQSARRMNLPTAKKSFTERMMVH